MATDYHSSKPGGPTWELVDQFPYQGSWTIEDYLQLDTRRLVEFDHGTLEFLVMPTEYHQLIVAYLWLQLYMLANAERLGVAVMAPLKVRVDENRFREPDVLFMLNENKHKRTNRFWDGADLVMEVVSEDDPGRDLVRKRADYAKAGIPEYWIVDPRDRSVLLLTLDKAKTTYIESSKYVEGDVVISKLLSGLSIAVNEIFDRPEASNFATVHGM